MPDKHFESPFKGQTTSDFLKLNCEIPPAAYNRVKACRLSHGTITTTMQLLWQKLIDELDKRNIRDWGDVKQFEHFVANAELRLPGELGSTFIGAHREADTSHDGQGASGSHADAEKPAVVSPVLSGVSRKGRSQAGRGAHK